MNPEERPQKGARKLTIDGDTWWYLIGRGAINIPIWDPAGRKTVYKGSAITEEPAITPFHLRIFIDRHIRELPEWEIKAFIEARNFRIEKERQEPLEKLRKSVLARAKVLVGHSNSLYFEYYGGDKTDLTNREENKRFLDDLLKVMCQFC